MRLGVVGIGDVMCPDGTNAPSLNECFGGGSGFDPTDPNSGVPVPPGGVLACDFGFVEVNGECMALPQTPISGGYDPNQVPSTSPTAGPVLNTTPTLPNPKSACPVGFTMTNAGCLPNSSPVVQQQQAAAASTTIIPGVPNWMTYGIGALAVLTLIGTQGGGRRR